ncbi:MAG TPA: DUF192 domain-containing protein [Candidatus Dojkabacteria bacterium]|nr:DUF192 domain-containing protein [Candidatus Dojkabacteria bacterium]
MFIYFIYKQEITDYINEQRVLNSYTYDTKTVSVIAQTKGGSSYVLTKFISQISDTDSKRELGLSFRKSLEKDKGMLFVFPNIVSGGFWMKDMKFNLDILFIDSNYKIIKIFRQLPPCTQDLSTCLSYSPGTSYQYVLEINGGLSESLGISEGQKISFPN